MDLGFGPGRVLTTLSRCHSLLHARLTRGGCPALRIRALSTQRTPLVIRVSDREVKNKKLNEQNLEIAVRGIHLDGLVVVENIMEKNDLDHLNKKMVEDARILQARGEDGPFNYNIGNLQQDPPPYVEYFSPSIFTNPIVTQITSAVLGPRPKWAFCSGNTAMPVLPGASPQRQPVHTDADFAHPAHPFALVVNIPLVDMTPQNGSTELWLGSHLNTSMESQEGAHGERASGRIKEDLLAKWVAIHGPPIQPPIQKGSVIIRDLRLWHAGMPNMSKDVRVMLALIHFANWYRVGMKLEFAYDINPVLVKLKFQDQLDLEIPVNWVPKDQVANTYLSRAFGNAYDFNQLPYVEDTSPIREDKPPIKEDTSLVEDDLFEDPAFEQDMFRLDMLEDPFVEQTFEGDLFVEDTFTKDTFKENTFKKNMFNTFRSDTFKKEAFKNKALKKDTFRKDAFKTDAFKTNALIKEALRKDAFKTNALKTDTFRKVASETKAFKKEALKKDSFRKYPFKTDAFNKDTFKKGASKRDRLSKQSYSRRG
ncbi:hypothetical protein GGR50DRAFT_682496 [Xylaria sp. CBS 124048]|nr:hypothetical protein GGR50DRAFT_682496 [Xylaria sp. CBS 124048]